MESFPSHCTEALLLLNHACVSFMKDESFMLLYFLNENVKNFFSLLFLIFEVLSLK